MTDLRSWKLIHDPFLKKGLQKLVRYDGVVPGNPAYNVHHLSDPRTLVPSRHPWGGREPLDIPIPPFQIDENYVCPPPPREVSFTDLNDNISPAFLADLCRKCGEYDDLKIFYHPVDKRHLGIGRVVFKKMKYASMCIEKYDGTSIMGKCVRVFLDPFGKKVKKLEQELSTDEPSAGTSAKENISASKRCQNTVSTAAPLQASETPSIATPQCVTTVPEDPMSSQQSSSYPPQVYPNCLPPSSMPPYPWPVPQNYWPQGAQWPQPPWPVPFPPTFPPYPQQQLQEVGHNVWQPVAETHEQSDDYNSVDKKGKETRKSFDNKHSRDRERGRSMDFRKNQRRNRTPEPRPPSSATSSKSRDRHESDRKDRSDGMREAIDKHAQRFVNKMSRRSPSPRRRSSLERKHSPTIRKHSPSDRKHSPSDRKPSPIDRKHSPSDRGDRRSKRRDDRSSSSIRRDRDDSVERHRHRSRTPPPKKLGNKLYHWHNRMHSSPIVAKYESYSYGNRNSKESKKRNDDLRRRGGEKLCFNKIKKENDSDPENRRHKNEHEPIVEYEEEYYRRKKLAPSSFEQSSGNTDKRTIIDKEQHVNIPSTSTNFVDEIEEYKFVSRKLCQRVAYPVNENDGKIAGVDKLEVISSTEDDDEEIRYSNPKNYMSSKIGRKNSNRRPCSSNSSNNSSVHLQYSSLSEGESANESHVKHHHKRVDQRSMKNAPHLEQVSSLERDDVSDISSSSSPVARSRRRNRSRKHRDEPKHIVREVFKEKRADLKTISRKNKLSSEDGTGSGTPLVDEPLPNFKKTIAGDGKKLDSVRPSSTLEKRIQTMLRGDGKIPTDGYGTPLQDEPLIDEKTTATSNIADKNETNDDDDRMSLSSGQSRPTSRNEDGGVDQSQKSSIVPAVPTMAMPAYGGYAPNYNPYDPIHYAMMYAANMVNPYSMPPGAQQFPPQMQMWPQNFPPYSQTPCEIVKPVGVSIDFNDPQVIKRLTNKTCVDIVKDLKAVLHKDISKRLIENSAFQILDSWFSKQDKVNEILKPKNESDDKQTPISSIHAASTTNVTTSLSRLFVNDTNNSLTGSNSGSDLTRLFGFGLRATLPKLPSFKRKAPPPQPSQRRHRDDDRSARNRKPPSSRLRSVSSSSSSRSRSDDSSDDDDDEEEEGRKSRTSQSSTEENDPKKIQLKEGVVMVSSDSDDDDESTQTLAVRDTKLLKISSDESEKSSVSDESDDENENNKSSSDVNSDESSSSNSSGDDSDNESSVENEKEGASVKKLNDLAQKNSSFERSFVDRSPTSLGVYGENLDDKENLIVEKNSKEIRRINEDSVECMAVDDADQYRPTVYDHCYFYPSAAEESLPNKNQEQPIMVAKTMLKKNPVKRGRPANKEKVSDLLKLKRAALVLDRTEGVNSSKKISSKTRTVLPPAVAAKREILFKPRDALSETKVLFDFLTNGIDEEDINYLKRAYDAMLAESIVEPCLQNSHWTSHVPTVSSPAKKRRIAAADDFHVHTTGCARSEGFYRPSGKIKRTFTKATRQANDDAVLPPSLHAGDQAAKQQAQLSREARSNQRRLLTTLGDADFLKFNQLKYRKKLIRFSRSNIHGWGLFALEDIGQDEMIIEYVGEKVRLNVAEKRERNYEKKGIGSSYLFRIDNEMVIDATKRGAVARFINHSCNPSCYAKIISLDGEKRIVIYSKQLIAKGEEITYDYKFPFEDVKIPCNCGAHNCRGSLN